MHRAALVHTMVHSTSAQCILRHLENDRFMTVWAAKGRGHDKAFLATHDGHLIRIRIVLHIQKILSQAATKKITAWPSLPDIPFALAHLHFRYRALCEISHSSI